MHSEILRFYLHERLRVGPEAAWEWLLREARDVGVAGGSAFRAIGGFGRDLVLHEYKFFELADSQTIAVEFVLTNAEAEALLARVERERMASVFTRIPVTTGHTGSARPGGGA